MKGCFVMDLSESEWLGWIKMDESVGLRDFVDCCCMVGDGLEEWIYGGIKGRCSYLWVNGRK